MRNLFKNTISGLRLPAAPVGCFSMALIVVLCIAAGCSDRKTPVEIETHVAAWNTKDSEDFHGIQVARLGMVYCEGCHGKDWMGDEEAPGCYGCHAGPGGHSFRYNEPNSRDFHAYDVEEGGNSYCANCHGEDFRGGWSGTSCYTCHGGGPSGHPGPEIWFNDLEIGFHGYRVFAEGADACARCHGDNLRGGTSGVACTDCHLVK